MSPGAPTACPGCGGALDLEIDGDASLWRCRSCDGCFVDPGSLERLVASTAAAPAELVGGTPARRGVSLPPVTYRRCPVCGDVMSRTNFARMSGVILDVCRPHGAFLDPGELALIRRFLRGPGLRRFAVWRDLDRERARRRAPPGDPAAGLTPERRLLEAVASLPRSRYPASPWARAALTVAAGLAGLWSLWEAVHATTGFYGRRGTLGGLLAGAFLLWLAFGLAHATLEAFRERAGR